MASNSLLKKYRNSLFEAIRTEGLNPDLFETSEKSGSWDWNIYPYFIVKLKNSGLSFWVMNTSFDNRFTARFSSFPREVFSKRRWVDFVQILGFFKVWLNEDVRGCLEERNLPDLWSELETYKSFFDEVNITNEGASDFTGTEKADIRSSIAKYKLLLEENFHPNPEQTEFVSEQLDYLANAVERLNRFDWRGLAFSTLMGIAVNLCVDTEKGKLIFSLFQQALQSAAKLLH